MLRPPLAVGRKSTTVARWSTNKAMRHAERELALQAQRAYERTLKDRQQSRRRCSSSVACTV
jgi:hypothetical protein